MINDLFVRNYPHPSCKTRPVLIHQTYRNYLPYVVPVPIQFIPGKQPQKPLWIFKLSATLKIQKVFRGFLVRKSVKKISVIRNQVIEIERRVNDKEIVELILRDKKKRLRVHENLMNLLLKLDSIRGVDLGVRDFRKTVCNKAILLQKRVDSIVESKKKSIVIGCENLPDSYGSCVEIVADFVMNQSAQIGCENRQESFNIRDKIVESKNESVESLNRDKFVESMNKPVEVADYDGLIDVPLKAVKESDDNCDPDESINNKKRNTQMLEKLLDDNEKIFERNEMQTWMLNSLSQRVKQIDKSFMCDGSRKKKSKRHST